MEAGHTQGPEADSLKKGSGKPIGGRRAPAVDLGRQELDQGGRMTVWAKLWFLSWEQVRESHTGKRLMVVTGAVLCGGRPWLGTRPPRPARSLVGRGPGRPPAAVATEPPPEAQTSPQEGRLATMAPVLLQAGPPAAGEEEAGKTPPPVE